MSALQLPLTLPKYLQEDELTQECKDVISSLPSEEGWVSPHLHQYKGFWITTRYMQGVLSFQKHFQAHETDILLATTPKAGATWLKAILYALVNRAHYPDPQKHPLVTRNPHDLVPFMEISVYSESQVPDLSSFTSLRLFSTHLSYGSLPTSVKDSAGKIVYLCRNPKDTFVSLWQFTNKLRPANRGIQPLEEAFEKFFRGVSLFGPYWDHVLSYWNESLKKPQKVFFLKFEEMKRQPVAYLHRLAEFIGCPISREEEANGVVNDILGLCSFDYLSTLEVNKSGQMATGEKHDAFFRRGDIGDWTNYLTIEMIEKLDRITEEKFDDAGLRF